MQTRQMLLAAEGAESSEDRQVDLAKHLWNRENETDTPVK